MRSVFSYLYILLPGYNLRWSELQVVVVACKSVGSFAATSNIPDARRETISSQVLG
jgi:hypothetical protein